MAASQGRRLGASDAAQGRVRTGSHSPAASSPSCSPPHCDGPEPALRPCAANFFMMAARAGIIRVRGGLGRSPATVDSMIDDPSPGPTIRVRGGPQAVAGGPRTIRVPGDFKFTRSESRGVSSLPDPSPGGFQVTSTIQAPGHGPGVATRIPYGTDHDRRGPDVSAVTGVFSAVTGVFSAVTGVFSAVTGVFSAVTGVFSAVTGVFSAVTGVLID
jgi:hypothetical protein